MLKKNVLRRKSDFSSIYNRGNSLGDKYIVLFFKKNELGYNRIAFLASKKVGNAVHRNRARRLMKESIRLLDLKNSFPELESFDLIFIARKSIEKAKCHDVKGSIANALRRAGFVSNKKF